MRRVEVCPLVCWRVKRALNTLFDHRSRSPEVSTAVPSFLAKRFSSGRRRLQRHVLSFFVRWAVSRHPLWRYEEGGVQGSRWSQSADARHICNFSSKSRRNRKRRVALCYSHHQYQILQPGVCVWKLVLRLAEAHPTSVLYPRLLVYLPTILESHSPSEFHIYGEVLLGIIARAPCVR